MIYIKWSSIYTPPLYNQYNYRQNIYELYLYNENILKMKTKIVLMCNIANNL